MSSRTKLDLYSPSHRWLRYLLGYLSLLLVSILSKVKIKGRHHIPETGPYIVAINHFSLVDPAFVVSALQRPIIFWLQAIKQSPGIMDGQPGFMGLYQQTEPDWDRQQLNEQKRCCNKRRY